MREVDPDRLDRGRVDAREPERAPPRVLVAGFVLVPTSRGYPQFDGHPAKVGGVSVVRRSASGLHDDRDDHRSTAMLLVYPFANDSPDDLL